MHVQAPAQEAQSSRAGVAYRYGLILTQVLLGLPISLPEDQQ